MVAEYIMALDYGEKRVGVALAHQVARLPRPYTTLANTPELIPDIQNLVTKEAVGLVVVGLPRGMDGGYTEQTRSVEAFVEQLRPELSVPVMLADETLTSVDAETQLSGRRYSKTEVDALAAANILDRYLLENPNVMVRT